MKKLILGVMVLTNLANFSGVLHAQELKEVCEINEDNLNNFLNREIPADIECLSSKVELFLKVVEPDSPATVGKLSQNALENYIRIKEPKLINILKYTPLFFKLSHLVFGEKIGYLSAENIARLTTAAIEVNKEFALISSLVKDSPKNEFINIHLKKSEILVQSTFRISSSIEKLFKASNNLEPLSIEDSINAFANENNKATIEKLKSVAFIKRILVGGNLKTASQHELRQLVGLFPVLVKIGYNLAQFKALVFENEVQRYKFLSDVVVSIEDNLYFKNSPAAKLFEISDIENSLKKFQVEIGLKNIVSYFSIIPELKAIFGNSSDSSFVMNDLNKIISHVKKMIGYGEAFSGIYYTKNAEGSNQVLLESKNPIAADLLISNPLHAREFKDFVRIAKDYRFYKGNDLIPTYSSSYNRNLKGMIDTIQTEYLFSQIASQYERNYPCNAEIFIRPRPFANTATCSKDSQGRCVEDLRCKNGEDFQKTLSQGQIELIVVKLSGLLQELGLVTKNMEYSAAENIFLMSDLFQFQSNSNGLVDKNEFAELVVQALSTLSMKKNIISAVKNLCPDQISVLDNGHTVYGADCFRKNFLEILYTKFERGSKQSGDLPVQFQYADYLPSLANFLDRAETPIVTFVNTMEQFTNSCYDYYAANANDSLYESYVIGVFGGLFSVEAILTRFDTNPIDSYLTGPEIETAFKHFSNAVQSLSSEATTGKHEVIISSIIDSLGTEEISKRIFYYMLKYREVPNVSSLDKAWKFAKHLLNKKYREGVMVDRITMAAVLSGIKSSSKNKATPYQLNYICNKKPLPTASN